MYSNLTLESVPWPEELLSLWPQPFDKRGIRPEFALLVKKQWATFGVYYHNDTEEEPSSRLERSKPIPLKDSERMVILRVLKQLCNLFVEKAYNLRDLLDKKYLKGNASAFQWTAHFKNGGAIVFYFNSVGDETEVTISFMENEIHLDLQFSAHNYPLFSNSNETFTFEGSHNFKDDVIEDIQNWSKYLRSVLT